MKIVMVSNLGDDRSPWDVASHECRTWAYVLGGDTRNATRVSTDLSLLAGYDLAIIELTTNLLSLPARVKQVYPDLILVGLLEGWVANIAGVGVDAQCDFVEACRALDMVGILVERALSYYRLFVPDDRKVQWLGLPFPKAWTDQLRVVPYEEKEFVVMMPFALRPVRSGIAHLLAFRRLQKQYPRLRGLAIRSLEDEELYLHRLGIEIELAPPRDWASFFQLLSRAYAVLNLDHLPTWGRFVAECAAGLVPYVGSNATQCGGSIGVLTCDPFDSGTALSYLARLLDRDDGGTKSWYQQITEQQYRRLGRHDEHSCRERFWRALDRALSPAGGAVPSDGP